ncbi:hypothetical protein T310_10179 [Rasamsonia emersonii CBS 393.64]|uniref:Uncharacterized protein n=1 Tax=Rasamsonia emersonii (strain ATCC 16479 / CBS 393.64 / IMI 116815) TaxID=1408163 RepID=A0A0F4YDF6_RASE3|nr:hypothetical protein T310_10179 [Rasamsonia emersonii CBS 393.64]KKA16237.1 hypothetical protein T310_10179 [Rasamsonia emersonii CBS 393.64]
MRCETSQNHKSIQSNGMDRREMHDDLAICSPTVLGFCLDKKLWDERSYQWDSVELGLSAGLREFAVENVEEIRFTESPFDMLIIPGDKKRSSNLSPRAVSARQMKQGQAALQEWGRRLKPSRNELNGHPISSGDLSTRAEELEVQLTRTFRIVSDWKAVLFLKEADVYLQQRDSLQLGRNHLVATFLRTLEYYNGIFFLKTNLLTNFDVSILDRTHLKLRYDNLDSSVHWGIFNHFLSEAKADVKEEELSTFAEISLNGRQIKNVVEIARNVAINDSAKLCADHIQTALTASGYAIPTKGALPFDNSLYE